jgi:hypothetical protein
VLVAKSGEGSRLLLPPEPQLVWRRILPEDGFEVECVYVPLVGEYSELATLLDAVGIYGWLGAFRTRWIDALAIVLPRSCEHCLPLQGLWVDITEFSEVASVLVTRHT